MIDNDLKLSELISRLRVVQWIALDTEADSLHAYPEKICLLQVSTQFGDELIDPLSGIHLAPLLETLGEHEIIMHGADYDLRLFRKHQDFVPKAIFDTMLASRLLGITQFGLTHLAAKYLGVTLDKGPQKADWARRPLTERMETYARHDTHYLKELSDRLREELAAKGRLDWHRESCERLIQECSQLRVPDPNLVWRVKGSHRLSRQAMAVLREIYYWREAEATSTNRPPYFILQHESMVDIAAAAAAGRPFDNIIPKRYPDRRRESLMEAILKGMDVPAPEQPEPLRPTGRRTTDSEKKRMAHLQQLRDQKASELGIDPTLIASRATLLALSEDWTRYAPELMKWQRELLMAPRGAKSRAASTGGEL